MKFSKEYQSYVAQGHAAGRFLSVAAGEWFSGRDQALAELFVLFSRLTSGLCRGWTSPEPGSVDREVFTSMWPKAMDTVFCLVSFDVQHLISAPKCSPLLSFKAGKQPMISLFSGVGGLDLGLSEHTPQFTEFFSCSTFASTLHFMRSMKFDIGLSVPNCSEPGSFRLKVRFDLI